MEMTKLLWTDLFGIDPNYTRAEDEPAQLLAVVEELGERKRRWYRWAYDNHTSQPWELMGAVHVGGEDTETCRWDDLPPVQVVSEGVPVCRCASCRGPRG
jgi:hypothetical protein